MFIWVQLTVFAKETPRLAWVRKYLKWIKKKCHNKTVNRPIHLRKKTLITKQLVPHKELYTTVAWMGFSILAPCKTSQNYFRCICSLTLITTVGTPSHQRRGHTATKVLQLVTWTPFVVRRLPRARMFERLWCIFSSHRPNYPLHKSHWTISVF